MAGWVDKSASNAILNVAPGISVGIQQSGKTWIINVVGTKSDVSAADINEVKRMAESLLHTRLKEAQLALSTVSALGVPELNLMPNIT